MAVLVFFIFLQITDFFFTLHGVNAVGIDKYESNPLFIFYMHRFGVVESLVAVKVGASLLGYILYRVKVTSAIWFLNGLYFKNLYDQITLLIHYSG